MTVSDAVNEAAGSEDFYNNVGNVAVAFEKKVASNSVKAIEVASKIRTSITSKIPMKELSSTPDLIKFATTEECTKIADTGRGLYLSTRRK